MIYFRIFCGLPEAQMVLRRWICAVLACALLFSFTPLYARGDSPPAPTSPVSFSDTADHWAKDAIDRWSSLGIVVGSEGKFRPDDSLTRAEMAVILTRILRYRTASEELFLDLAEDWYVDAIQKLRAAGVMRGDENNHASPDAPVTREEAVVLIARAFDIAPLEGDLSYADANDVSDWAAGCVGAMTAAEYIRGGGNNCFFPKNPLTRAEAVTIFNNMITACFYESGEYDYRPFEGLAKFVIIAADDVTILNFDIGGNILLAEGVNPETIRLKTVQHYGNIYQCVPGEFIRHLKASSYIVPINEHLPVCSWDSSLFVKDEQGRMRYADDTVTTYFGVDVSSWQGNVDWHKLKAQGVHFAFLRVGYRGYESGVINPDTKFEENIKGALDAGIHVGVYFFSQALDGDEAYAEALYVLDKIKDYNITFPVVFDWETVSSSTARTNNMDTEKLCQAANVFCNTVADAGYIPMVYCNQNVSLLYYELSRIQAFDFWYAEYKDQPTFYYDFDIWQYSASAKLDGVPDALIDVNISFVDYSQRKP